MYLDRVHPAEWIIGRYQPVLTLLVLLAILLAERYGPRGPFYCTTKKGRLC